MVAFAGAGPWPQITSVRPRLTSCTITGTSPPGPFRCGSTTCSVKAGATPASKALPPFSSVAIPTALCMATLEKGGNAYDAGLATAFTLQVVEPHLNGPGGDVPIIVHDVKRGRTEVICGQGPAPAKATIAHYKREGLEMVPGTGLLAACVPGTFESWMLLLRDYGTMRLRDVLEPAICYAGNGYPLV